MSTAPHPDALHEMAVNAYRRGNVAEAQALIERAIAANGSVAHYHNTLGEMLHAQGRLDDAITSFHRCTQLDPALPEGYNNLGVILYRQGFIDAAAEYFRKAIALNPAFAEAHSNMGNALRSQGFMEAALASYRQALTLDPRLQHAYANMLMAMHYDPAIEPAAFYAAHVDFAQRYLNPLAREIVPHANDRTPNRRLRIGYLSGDFRRHAVAYFIEPVLQAHDYSAFEVICYATNSETDTVTRRLQGYGARWRNVAGRSEAQIAQDIRQDTVDILVDLSGNTTGGALGVLARKPAPVIVSYLGYPDTTGLATVDYRFTDANADPVGVSDSFYTERLVRLPDTFLCYRPFENSPPLALPPVLQTKSIVFACLNNFAKVTPMAVAVWAHILNNVPGSRMVVRVPAPAVSSVRVRLCEQFFRCGVGPDRLILAPPVPDLTDLLRLYNQVDIALDTFPYNGTTTTCEALWMGVPVVTMEGRTHSSRVGVSLLKTVGLGALIATSVQSYLDIAVGMSHDVEQLRSARVTMRQRLEASPLLNGPRHTRNVESAYRQMWAAWCGG